EAVRGGVDVTVADIDWERFVPGFVSARPSRLLAELPEAVGVVPVLPAGGGGPGLREELEGVPEGRRRQVLLDVVRAQAAVVLGHSGVQAVEPDRAFRDLGFDSLMAVELRNLLSARTGLRLPTTLVFDHPTPEALVDHLRTELTPGEAQQAASVAEEIDRLETSLLMLSRAEGERFDVSGRLQALLTNWRKGTAPDEESVADDVLDQAASADEVLQLIQKEFGGPQ
ncbi:beta-ketoacyl reductase, partial [Streptomyces sp. NPDC005566]|uniref:acyl carrier protein n=1 Tax=Streptomyces sp. NPDC005566 TaxID=3156886 RepID=UPI0033A1BB2E